MAKIRIERGVLQVFLIWLGWALFLNGFQHFVVSRFQPARPDRVLEWTAAYTQDDPLQRGEQPWDGWFGDFYPDLRVAWDSGFYLSIATKGYDDPDMPAVQSATGEQATLNYSFLPLYPYSIRFLGTLLQPLGLGPLRTPIYAGVLISLLGALGGAIALYDLAGGGEPPGDGTRAAFYMLIFPSGFFLAQVYTEGLFVGLAFGCLALIRRKRWAWASVLAALATMTRTVGIGLALALGVALLAEIRSQWLSQQRIPWATASRLLLVLIPITVFLVWFYSPLGRGFEIAARYQFGRQPFAFGQTLDVWRSVFSVFGSGNRMRIVYYGLEIAAICLALAACVGVLRHNLPLALFSVFAILTALLSGPAQSMVRYVAAVPAIYLFLGRLGRNEVFDRLWTLLSLLLMGTLLTLFTFEMWVG